MRHDHRASGADTARRAYQAASDEVAVSEAEVAAAAAHVAAAEARLGRCRTRLQRLRDLATGLASQVQQWWRLAATALERLPAVSSYEEAHAQAHIAEQQAQHAARRAQQASERVDRFRQRQAILYAELHGWQGIIDTSSAALHATATIADLTADERLCYTASTSAADRHQQTKQRSIAATTAAQQAATDQSTARREAARLTAIREGIGSAGLSTYLARASPADRAIIQTLNAEAQREGSRSRGRRPPTADDPRVAAKAKRAAAARERRARQRAAGAVGRDVGQKVQHREDRRVRRQADRASDAICPPQRRFHHERMLTMAPDERITYQHFLDWSRRRGHAAAIADAEARHRAGDAVYHAAHPALALGPGARLIAVRGVDAGQDAVDWAHRIQADPGLMERWLAEPMHNRTAKKGSRQRLRHGAIHIVAAWSPMLIEAARSGALDEALAREVDLFVARFDLRGHRVAAILHTDADGAQPHLHIVASRIRTADLSLWSLPGRERAVSLWLHARSNTAVTHGLEALDDDIDALSGRSTAAKAGEALLAHGQLAAVRSLVDGQQILIALQGTDAAARVSAVGRHGRELAGGLWLFGLGADPAQDHPSWRDGQQHAQQRGYWLSAESETQASGYAAYLSRLALRRTGT